MDDLKPIAPVPVPQTNQPLTSSPLGQTKVDIFSLGKDMKSLMEKLKKDREALTTTFDQTENAVRLLADLFSDEVGNKAISIDLYKFEQAGIDISQVLKTKINQQVTYIDGIAYERGIKSNLAEQFTHYDDRHTGAEAKRELLEDIETQLMSTIYNQINEIRNKIDNGVEDQPAAAPQAPQNTDQFTVDPQAK